MKKNDPFTREDQTRFTMRIDTELLEQIKAEAEKNKRSALICSSSSLLIRIVKRV